MDTTEEVTVIDYEILYRNGHGRRFLLRPDKGDTETKTDTHLIVTLQKGAMTTEVCLADIVESTRYEHAQRVRVEGYVPAATKASVANT